MRLIADNKTITTGTLEHCIYCSNTMTAAERKQYRNIFIAEENKVIYLRKDGKEKPFDCSSI